MQLQTIEHRGSRPGPGWHRHGWTVRTLTIRIGRRLQRVLVKKQRWRHVATGKTLHDRPAWEFRWASATIDVAFHAVATRLQTAIGESKEPVPRSAATGPPSDRTVLRWLNRLRADALAWQHAIRLAVINRLVPRPLEEILPPGGVPPPAELRYRLDRPTEQLVAAVWFLVEATHHVDVAAHTLLVEARRDPMTAL